MSGGALIAGLVFGWLRSVKRTFAGFQPRRCGSEQRWPDDVHCRRWHQRRPSFVAGLKQAGVSLFFAGIVATSIPLIIGVLMGNMSQVSPGINPALRWRSNDDGGLGHDRGCCKSKVPALGYTVTYAVGNTC
jgi:putative transport protein